MPERDPKFDKAARAAKKSGLGKLLPEALYLHKRYVPELPALLRAQIARAHKIGKGQLKGHNIVKVGLKGDVVSFLSYPGFDSDSTPTLDRSVIVNVSRGTVQVKDYSAAPSPPVLHRKEALVKSNYPGYEKFKRLTESEEAHGLLSTKGISTKGSWERLLAQKGLTIRGDKIMTKSSKSNPKFGKTLSKLKQNPRAELPKNPGETLSFLAQGRRFSSVNVGDGLYMLVGERQGTKPIVTRIGTRSEIRKDIDHAQATGLLAVPNPNTPPSKKLMELGQVMKLNLEGRGFRRVTLTPGGRSDVEIVFPMTRLGVNASGIIRLVQLAGGKVHYVVSQAKGLGVALLVSGTVPAGSAYANYDAAQAIGDAAQATDIVPQSRGAKNAELVRLHPNPVTADEASMVAAHDADKVKAMGFKRVSTTEGPRGSSIVSFSAWKSASQGEPERVVVSTHFEPRPSELHVRIIESFGFAGTRLVWQGDFTNPDQAVGISMARVNARTGYRPENSKETKSVRGGFMGMFTNPADAMEPVIRIFKAEQAKAKRVHPELGYIKLKLDPHIHDTPRSFACCGRLPGEGIVIMVAPELAHESANVIRGIIRHEFGHAVDFLGHAKRVKITGVSDYDRRERQADVDAERIFGEKIYYDARDVEVSGKGAKGKRPRPQGLK